MVTMLLTSSLSAAVAAGASQTLPRGNGCHVCFALPWLHRYDFRGHVPLFRLLFPPFQKYITKGYVSEEEAGERLAQVVSDPSLGKSGVYWSWNNNSSLFENQLSKEASDAEKAKTVGG